MKPTTLEWIEKAEGDFAILERELRARKNPSYDGACFHAQQAVEKFFKAFLVFHDVDFTKVHDLDYLLMLCIKVDPAGFQSINLESLNDFGVSVRYPDDLSSDYREL